GEGERGGAAQLDAAQRGAGAALLAQVPVDALKAHSPWYGLGERDVHDLVAGARHGAAGESADAGKVAVVAARMVRTHGGSSPPPRGWVALRGRCGPREDRSPPRARRAAGAARGAPRPGAASTIPEALPN